MGVKGGDEKQQHGMGVKGGDEKQNVCIDAINNPSYVAVVEGAGAGGEVEIGKEGGDKEREEDEQSRLSNVSRPDQDCYNNLPIAEQKQINAAKKSLIK